MNKPLSRDLSGNKLLNNEKEKTTFRIATFFLLKKINAWHLKFWAHDSSEIYENTRHFYGLFILLYTCGRNYSRIRKSETWPEAQAEIRKLGGQIIVPARKVVLNIRSRDITQYKSHYINF